MRVIITGGHHNSALVVAQALKHDGHTVYWLGHRHTMLKDKHDSAEYEEVTKAGFKFYSITAGKLQLKHHFIIHLLRIPVGIFQSFWLVARIKPDFVYSSGGFIALPICIISWLLRIPIFTHEQTIVSGIANQIIARVAKRIYTAFPNSIKSSKRKLLYTGLPIRQEIYVSKTKIINNSNKTIYVTGGKQGSHTINQVIFQILPELLTRYNVIHQCGSNTIYHDFQFALKLKTKLGTRGTNYIIGEYFSGDEIGSVYNVASLVIGRSGAHTVYELLALKKPSLLIPIPWTHNDEQTQNALYLKKCGLAEILFEKDLTPESLLRQIDQMMSRLKTYLATNDIKLIEHPERLIIGDIYKHLSYKT